MRNIFTTRGLAALADFASSNVLLGFDYDGTLAPIVADPARARIWPRARELLRRVARSYPCIVISGRAYDDITKRLARLPVWHVFGNHGSEPWAARPSAAATVSGWDRRLRARLRNFQGIVIENKTYSIAIHYRREHDHPTAQRAISAAVRGLANVRVRGGDHAINLIVADAPDKGATLQHARRVLACDRAIFVGDDETDEDAFESAPPTHLLGIRVGRTRDSGARFCLRSQRDIDGLLRVLLECRVHRGAPEKDITPGECVGRQCHFGSHR
jgi:trehalose 6-phosphate phosphatase